MSRRKPLSEVRGHLTAAERKRRAAQEGVPFALGYPARPQGLARAARDLWNEVAQKLYARRLLSFTDGELLLQYVNAKQVGDVAAQERIAQTFMARSPFEEKPEEAAPENSSEPSAITLAEFLEDVAQERATFQQRMIPGETVTLDSNEQPYLWTEGDAATVARLYATDVRGGKVVSGELMVRAAVRFLSDLDEGHARGVFFDPVAARHIVQFAETFCDLKLLPWQVFVLANIFGFKKPTGARRFTEAWISCAKKNGKTRLASCIALFGLIADCEKYPDIFSAATKKEQSRIVWRDAKRAVQANADLAGHVQRWAGDLHVNDTDGSFTPLSSDEKSMDGLRPHVIIADEVAFW